MQQGSHAIEQSSRMAEHCNGMLHSLLRALAVSTKLDSINNSGCVLFDVSKQIVISTTHHHNGLENRHHW
jgi:hypothetical protein